MLDTFQLGMFFVFPFDTFKHKDGNTQKCHFACCYVDVKLGLSMVTPYVGGDGLQSAEGSIWM